MQHEMNERWGTPIRDMVRAITISIMMKKEPKEARVQKDITPIVTMEVTKRAKRQSLARKVSDGCE